MSKNNNPEKARRVAVLSRYEGQRVMVGDTVFRVLKIDGQRISVLIETDQDQEIRRPSKDEDNTDRKNAKESASAVRSEVTKKR